jgi:putative FmdB family regulatory protein
MPLLKYICEDCGKIFEELVFGENTPPCPECAGKNVKRYYRGKCYFGMSARGSAEGASSGSGCSCGGSCASCGGCH